MDIETLANEAWKQYTSDETQKLTCVIKDVIPILYFGDYEAYQKSPLKIITAGLNPSGAEFPDGTLCRFPGFSKIPEGGTFSAEKYLQCLNEYFRKNPYNKWFSAYDEMLEGFDSSFKNGKTNTVLHTDLCSPFATDPTWSKLDDEKKIILSKWGKQNWFNLLSILKPDIILVSAARIHISDILKQTKGEMRRSIWQKGTTQIVPIAIEHEGKKSWLFFGRAAQTPFGLLSKEDKRAAGQTVKAFYEKHPR
ncbi:hypothetical protein FACS1894161_2850 [Spirochaetia bacterium]|nr:hypothetical protein FACS1894161_2850 [Spirochaetia bacterium]